MEFWPEAFAASSSPVLSRTELLTAGANPRSLTAAVRFGHLIRLRNGRYCLPDCDPAVQRAVRVGGRIACVSALRSYGVFAFDGGADARVHLQLPHNGSRLRAPTAGRRRALTRSNRAGTVLHWGRIPDGTGESHRVSLQDALAEALICQKPWHAIASIDSALHQGLIDPDAVADLFADAPRRVQRLRDLVDGRAESGPETILRLIVATTGLPYELQVQLRGVGRVDLLVAGKVVLEADSKLGHEGWEAERRDRRRDLVAAALGYAALRPSYEHIMFEPELVRAALLRLVGRLGD